MRRVTLKLEPLDGRILPSVVSGDITIIQRGDYLVGNPPEGDEVVTAALPGSEPGTTGEGVSPFGTGYKPGTTGGLNAIGDTDTDIVLLGGSKPGIAGGQN
jgi:hypothetical protein